MAFELKDFFRSYVRSGDQKGLFNVVRADMDSTVERYNAYMNEDGSYIIQQTLTSGTARHYIYKYYAKKGRKGTDMATLLNTDWSNRTGLTYVDYYKLFAGGT
jgi:hypothetical protein